LQSQVCMAFDVFGNLCEKMGCICVNIS
jgi:hypothetical protein